MPQKTGLAVGRGTGRKERRASCSVCPREHGSGQGPQDAEEPLKPGGNGRARHPLGEQKANSVEKSEHARDHRLGRRRVRTPAHVSLFTLKCDVESIKT